MWLGLGMGENRSLWRRGGQYIMIEAAGEGRASRVSQYDIMIVECQYDNIIIHNMMIQLYENIGKWWSICSDGSSLVRTEPKVEAGRRRRGSLARTLVGHNDD